MHQTTLREYRNAIPVDWHHSLDRVVPLLCTIAGQNTVL